MILRPLHRRPIQGRYLAQCLFKSPIPYRTFHASPLRADDGMPDHYATLDLGTNASAGDIKKQFFKLSKKHHPDHNPDDPKAADRFVKISEAYHVLGSAEKRARYDRDFLRSSQPHHQNHPSGSYSSTGPAGGRPATGLSRRRTQFKGPPPSFYRSGGWGSFGEKRAEYAAKGSHAHEAAGESSAQDAPGTGPSGFTSGFNNDVPHFDREGHFRTHDAVQRNRHRARRRTGGVDAEDIIGSSSMLFNFVLLSGVLTVIFGVSGILFRKSDDKKKT